MKELIDKVERFLKQSPQNVISVSQGNKKLGKNAVPKYAFTINDIQLLFGDLESFFKKLHTEQGFTSGTTLLLRRMYGTGSKATYLIQETITLNFPNTEIQEIENETIMTNQQPITSHPQAALAAPNTFPAMGFVQITQNDLVRNEVIRERFDDLKKENSKLEDELREAKSEIRQLKDENFSLRLKIDTSEEKHQVDLKRQELDKKGFWESEAGGNIIGVLGQVLPKVAERMMQNPASGAVPALAMPSVSEIKQQFINIVLDPNVTDEQVTHWYNLIFSQNQ